MNDDSAWNRIKTYQQPGGERICYNFVNVLKDKLITAVIALTDLCALLENSSFGKMDSK